MPKTKKLTPKYDQQSGPQEVATPDWNSPTHQITIATDSTIGTVEVEAKYHPQGDFELLTEDDGSTPLVIDLSSNKKSFQIHGKWLYALKFIPTNVDNTYTPLIASGEMKV